MSKNLKPKFYEILNKSTTDSAVDVRIYGSIPDWNWDTGETNTAEQFVTDFKNLEKDYKRINIHINSPGGNLLEGFAMFNAIAASTADTHTYNDGVAFSLGGLLLLAGKTVHAAQHSLILIHNTQGYAQGEAQAMRDTADVMDKFDNVIAGILSNKSGIDKKQVAKTWLAYKDTVLTAEEAQSIGLVDVLETSQADIPQAIQNLYNAKSLTKDLANSFLNRQINLTEVEKNEDKELKGFFDVLKNFFSPKAENKAENKADSTVVIAIEQSPQFQELMNKLNGISTDLAASKAEQESLKAKNAELEQKVNEYGALPGALPTNPVATAEQHANNASQEELYKDKPWEDPKMEFNQRVDNNRLLNTANATALNIRGTK